MKLRAAKRKRLLVEELEPRILYSADAGAVANPQAIAPAAEVRALDLREVASPAANTPVTNAAAAPAGDSAAADAAAPPPVAESAIDPQTGRETAVRHELVFVDTSVNDYKKLLDDLLANAGEGRDIGVVLLDPGANGIDQVTQVLADQTRAVDAMHFITHGTEGAVKLGNVWLSSENLDSYANGIAGWKPGLAADADVLLYGCDVADNADGRALVDKLHILTGANVAASVDVTGDSRLGGNWNLEYTAGTVHTSGVMSQVSASEWSGVLATLTVSTTADRVDGNTSSVAALLAAKGADGQISLREAIIATNNTAGADQIILSTGTYQLTIAGIGEDLSALGDLDIRDALTITGAGSGSTFIDGNSLDRVFQVLNNSTATISGLTILNGYAPQGAGVQVIAGSTLNLTGVVVSGNTATAQGGGIQNLGTLTLTDVQITGNSVFNNKGGGLYNSGIVTATRVTIDGNSGKTGGGIHNDLGGNLTLTNVTISGNFASQDGGGIYNAAALTAINVTITGNNATLAGGGVFAAVGGNTSLKNTIVAVNTAGTGADVNGAVASSGNNLISNTAGSSGWLSSDLQNVAAQLDPVLRNNSGLTPTHALLSGSVAINAGNNTGAPATDQRGLTRTTTDIGAYEYGAASLVVDVASDNVDGNTSSIAALLASKGADGKISLREAITAANNTAGLDIIGFNISGGGVRTIQLLSALPTITDALVIDATTQPGYAGTPLIELDGNSAGFGVNGLTITAGGSTVRGLVINRFGGHGIAITSGGGNVVAGNYIGTNSAGTGDRGNGLEGINITNSANNRIGGTAVADRNVISGNDEDGIDVIGAAATGNLVQGNYIGLNATGTAGLGNAFNGIWMAGGASNNTIGGTAAGSGNVVAASGDDGIEMQDATTTGNVVQGNYVGTNAAGTAAIANLSTGVLIENSANNVIGGATAAARNVIATSGEDGVRIGGTAATGNIVQGNYIGTDATGTVSLGNTGAGVKLASTVDGGNIVGAPTDNTIGGTGAGAGNLISFNTGAGVSALTGDGNSIRGNSIYANGGLGIDLNGDGVTLNDLNDADGGANLSENFPLLTSALIGSGQIAIAGTFNSVVSTVSLDFYASPAKDASGYGEGRIYLGSASVTTNGSGNATFNAILSASVAAGDWISATATDTAGNTSEFGASIVAALNARPALSGANNLGAINEDAATNTGTLVSALIAGYGTDANVASLAGIAVTAVDNTNGSWQYSTNGGGAWNAFGTPTTSTARLLAADATTFVRFVPNSNWNGTVGNGITFRAWDQTSGLAGGTAVSDTGAYVQDNFDAGSYGYSNNSGSQSWTTSWFETGRFDSSQSSSGGDVRVAGGKLDLRLGGFSTGNPSSIMREANLAGATSATLSFSYTNALTTNDGLVVEISTNGTTFTTLPGGFFDLSTHIGTDVSLSYDITPWISATTSIRFLETASNSSLGHMYFDYVQIAYETASSATSAFSAATASSGIVVNPVNDAPAGVGKTVTTLEDTAYIFTAADFGFSDGGDSPVNSLLAVKMGTLPAAGTLKDNGVNVTLGQFVSVADIDSGKLIFTPAANVNGVAIASFTFQVQDDGGTANGGINLDVTPRTMTVNVTAVSDAPVGTNTTVTTLEGATYTFTASDFGFTDAADSPANNLISVRIAALPAAGSLMLSGIAVTAGQIITTANIAAGNLKFTPAANANGAGYASFTFQVQDDGGTANGGADLDATPRTLTVNVTSVNDAPVGTNKTVTALEDTAYAFTAADFGFTDPTDAASAGGANSLAAVKIKTLPAGGTFKDNGANVTVGQFVTVADINAGKLIYTPTANANGAAYASFTFQVQDNGGTANGGVNLDAVARTMTMNVTAVNDAPVAAGTATLASVREDTVSPAGATVSALFGGNFTDTTDAGTPAQNQLAGVAVRGQSVNAAQGRWQYSTDGGGNWSNFGALSDTNALSLGVTDKVRFLPGANFNGTPTDLSVRLIDNSATVTGGATVNATTNGGTTPFSSAVVTTSTAITAVNDAPVGADKSVTTLEDTIYTFTVADFGFSDPNDAAQAGGGNALLNVKITTLPAAGSLTVAGVAVTTGQLVSLANISAGSLKFTPAANGSGAAYGSFTFQVQDDGGTANGGVNLDATPRTMIVNVTAINDAPVGTNKTVTTLEDTPYTFAAADFGMTDPADSPVNLLANVKITTLPVAGTLALSGVAVTAGQFVSVANINAGNLTFVPAANVNGAGYASFTFQVQDDGGTANGGINLDATPRTLTVNVTAVNDAPVISQLSLAVTEGLVNVTTANNQTEAVAAMDGSGNFVLVWTSDNQDGGGKGVYARRYSVTGIAQGSEFRVNTTTAGDQKTAGVAMDSNGNFVVTWTGTTAGAGGTPDIYAQRFNAAGVAQGGEFRVNLTTSGTQDQSVVAIDGSGNFVVAWKDVSAPKSDVYARRYDSAGNALTGEFRANTNTTDNQDRPSVAMNANGAFVIAWKSNNPADGSGKGVFAQRYNAAGTAQGSEFQVNTTGSGNQDKPSAAMTANGDFVIAWVSGGNQDGDGNGIYAQRYNAAGAKQGGEFRVNTTTADNQDLPSAAMDGAGNFVIAWASNNQDGNSKGIYAQRYDATGAALGGEFRVNTTTAGSQDSPAIAMSPAGDLVTVWQGQGTGDGFGVFMQLSRGIPSTREDTALVLSTANSNALSVADVDAGGATVQATVTVTYGVVTLAGTTGLSFSSGNGVADATMTFTGTIAAINAALDGLSYMPSANFNGRATLTLNVNDQGNTGVGGTMSDSKAVAINVIAVNDAPVGTNKVVTTLEDMAYTFAAADFGFTDPADAPANALLNVKITTLPGAGSLMLSGVAVATAQFVSMANINAGNLKYVPAANANGAAAAAFTFQVQDDGGIANGGINLDATPRTMTVNVTSVNDAPVGANKTVTLLEESTYTFTVADFGFTDPGDAAGAAGADALVNVKITTLPAAGSLKLSGVAVTAGQFVSAANITAGNLKFTPAANANGAAYAAFTFQAQDNGGTANGGVDLDTSARTMTMAVTAVNDAPVGTSKTVTALEDITYVFTAADFGFTDPNDSPANALLNVKIMALPGAGTFTLSGVAVTANQFVSVANINAGNLRFTAAANADGAAYASFTFKVQDDGGTANGGVDLDASARTMTVDVTSVNDAPAGTNKTVTTLEDTAYTFSAADFGFTDPADAPVNALLNVKITTLPGAGSLTLSGVAVATGQFVSVANINAGNLKFVPAANANGAGYAAFTFQVQDDGGTANGGISLDATPRTMTVNVTSVNDAPVGTNKTVTTLEDSVYTFTAADFGFTDPADAAGAAGADALSKVRITTIPGAGSLKLSGAAVSAGQLISLANINGGNLKFTPAATANGAGYAAFTFQVQDDGGTANGGVDLDTSARTMTVNVTSVNDAPAGASKTVTTLEDTAYVFSAADFGFTDPNDTPANALSSVRITALPGAGSLALSGVAVTANQNVSVANVNAGNLKFTPGANANGAAYASFTFKVQDDGGTANGGVDLDATPRTMTVNVTAVNDAPVNSLPAAQNTLKNIPLVFSTGNGNAISISDIDAGNNQVQLTLTVTHGTLTLAALSGLTFSSGTGTGDASMTFTGKISHINAALDGLTFDPNLNYSGPADLNIATNDLGNTGIGGALVTTNVVAINVDHVNSAPTLAGANDLAAINEDETGNAGTLVSALIAGQVTDPDPSPLEGIAVTAVDNTRGAWEYSTNGGSSWTAFGSPSGGAARLLAADANSYVRFVPTADWNGTVTGGLTFQAWDRTSGTAGASADATVNGGTTAFSIASAAAGISINSVNDAPVGSSTTITVLEDAVYTFTAADFGFTDPGDVAANVFANVRITTTPGAGSLTRSGLAVTAGQFVAVADINAGNLAFTPVADANGVGYASFTFQVQDDGGTANGGVDLDTTPRTMTVSVTPVNDAPVGTNNTVTTNEDAAYTFTAADFGFTDPTDAASAVGANTLAAVKIAALPVAGTLALSGVAVAAGQFVAVADINAGNLKFTPVADANGAGYASFTFRVQDNGGVANGGIDLDSTPRTMTVDVTAVNDAPAGADNTVTTREDTAYTFSAADFGFTDAADSPAHALLNVKITALPGAGTLSDNGSAVVAGQFVSLADITAGNLKFTPAANANGTGYAFFTFQVRDDGGVANGGVDLDTAPRALTVNVTAVNDAPVGTNHTVTTLEDTVYTFTAADFGFTDPADALSNALANVRIAALPGAGSLELAGAAVVAGQFVSVADINAGNLTFNASANANGMAYASFTFQVQDDGGTANGGVDLDAAARTMRVDVTSVNDAPVGTNHMVTTLEDTPYTFTAADFGFTDPTDAATPAGTHALMAVKVTTVPVAGTLALSGVAVTAGQFVAVADINAGNLKFAPAANANGAGYAAFTFQVQDDGGTANGGVDVDASARTLTVDVTSVNDAPVGTNNTVTTLEDTAYTFTAADFGFADAGDSPANALANVRITTLPGAGTLTNNGSVVVASQFVSVADINAGRLKFTPAADANGAVYASFMFQVQDDGGSASGGIDLDTIARSMTVDVVGVNDAPVGTSNTVTMLEDTAYTFTAADFGFTDPTDAASTIGAHSLTALRIGALPVAGTLTLSGVAVSAGQFVSIADINAGTLKFAPVANANGAAYASFTFQVQDDGAAANGGVDLDATPRTLTVNVTSVNDAPVGTDHTVTTPEDTTYVFTAADFGFTDPADSAVNVLLNVWIAGLPGAGTLINNGSAVVAGQFVSVADINAGNLKFTPVADANGAGYASFTFEVQDDGGVANGGVDLDATPRTLTVNVTAVNDAPVGADRTVTTLEDTAYTFTAADFGFTDPADALSNALANVRITALPGAGGLALSGVAVTAGQLVSIADINAGNLVFTPVANANGVGYASFTFQVQDDGGTANGGVDLDVTARTLTVDVTSVNDAPVGTGNTVTTLEDTAYTFTAADFGFTDPDDAASTAGANGFTSVRISALPLAGTLQNNGVNIVSGQFVTLADINAGKLQFTPLANASGTGYASFTFQVRDNGGTANGGIRLDATPRAMTVDVTAVNDAPAGTNNTVTTLEDTAYTFSAADFGFTDADDSPANALLNVRISSLPAAGTLTDNGVALVTGQSVSVAAISAGNLKFTPAANGNGVGYASFTFQVQDDGGVANGGVDLDTVPRTMTVNVTAVNDAPAGTNNTVSTHESTVYTFTATDFGFTDLADAGSVAGANTLTAVRIAALPVAGTLTLSGAAVSAGQFVSVAAINAGDLEFTPPPNANGAGYASFTFQVRDDGGAANGGADLDATPRTMTVDVTTVNNAPVGTNHTVTTLENTVYIFNAADFGFTDPVDTPAGGLANVRVASVPAAGSLMLSGVAVTAGQFVPVADINAGNLTFAAAADANGAAYASFTFQVQDDGGVAIGGVDLDATPRTLTVNVTAVNDAPAGTDHTVATFEDTPYTFTAADFGFTDATDAASAGGANALANVRITTLPAAGVLALNGSAVSAVQSVSVADINAGNLKFTPAANTFGAGNASFTFQVQDTGGVANGGIDLDATPRTITVDVTALNDAPAGANNTVTTLEDAVYVFTAADFGFTDAADSPSHALLAVQIGALPAGGLLQDNGVNVSAGQLVSVLDINAGKLHFIPAANANGAAVASFTFRVQDDGGTANGGVNLDAAARTMTVNVISVNDAPAGGDRTVTTLASTGYVFSVADFGFTDLNDAIANIFASVNIATLPAAGRLSANGVTVTAGQAISVAEIVAGRLVFTPVAGASGNNYASFTFQVQDNGGLANAGIDMDPTPRTLTVNVVAPLVVPIGPGPVLPPVVITPPAPGPVTSTPPAATTTAPSTATPAVTSPAHTAAPVVDASPARAPVADPAAAPPTRADGAAAGGQASGGSAQPAAIGLKGPGMLGLQWFNVGNSDAPSFMSGVAANTPADFKLAQIVSSAVQQSNFEHALDKTREGVEEQAQQEERIVSSAIMGSTGLSVGYLVWLLRSGALISSLLSSLPAWRTLDPFPVLSNMGEEEEDEEDDDSLEALVAQDGDKPEATKQEENA